MSEDAAIKVGAAVGPYEVWGRIGGGGMSDVWLAKHSRLAMPVILKTLKTGVGGAASERYERLMREARLMARVIDHRVVRPLDVGLFGETPFLAQEYVDGIDIEEMDLRRRQALGYGLPLWFVCESLGEVAAGLHAAHQTGILHRDIKPANLFFSPESGIKLGDFGIARGRQTAEPKEVTGTLRFMAPEALRGEPLDRRSDIYALGATGYSMRHGGPPFLDVAAAMRGKARPLFQPPLSPEEAYFQHVLGRAMASDREDRYPDLNEPRRQLLALAASLRRPFRAMIQADGSLLAGATRVVCEVGDIARIPCDGVVSASNPQFDMNVGVSLALVRAGGVEIEVAAKAHGDQPLGGCVVTHAGLLPCRRVIHAVSAWQEISCVGRAMQRALLAAEEEGLRVLAVPALGTGAAGVSFEASSSAIAAAVRFHLELGGSRFREIRFVLYDQAKCAAFREVLEGRMLGDGDGRGGEPGLQHTAPGISASAMTVDAHTHILPPLE
jgi:serine/threonine-protein kinase